MSGRIGKHLRSNVVGYIALFFALSTGSAVALSGSNTVFTDDIVNDQVYSADVRNDTLSGGGLAAPDLRPSSVGSSEVTADSLGSGDLAPGSVGTSEVATDSLSGGDINESGLGIVPNADQLDGITSGGFLQTADAAGGDLSGPFSNLQIGADAVGTNELAQLPGAAARATSAQTIEASPGAEDLALDLEVFDTGGLYTAPSDSITIGVQGTYLLSGEVGFAQDVDGLRQVRIEVDDTPVAVTGAATAPSGSVGVRPQVATIGRLPATDVVSLVVFHNAGNNIDTALFSGSIGMGYATLAVQWLGP